MSQPSFDLDLDPTPNVPRERARRRDRRGRPQGLPRGGVGPTARSTRSAARRRVTSTSTWSKASATSAWRCGSRCSAPSPRPSSDISPSTACGSRTASRCASSGRVELYEARGQVNLRMSGIDPTYTLGRLAQDRDRLVRLLTGEGLLERNRRLVLAPVPLRIGIVTSRESAAYADFMHELEASGFAWHVMVADSRVQGIEATGSIVRGARRARAVLARRRRGRPRRGQPQRARRVRRRADRARDRRDARACAHRNRARGRPIDRGSRRSHVAEDTHRVRGTSRRASAGIARRPEPIGDGHRAMCAHRARPAGISVTS